MYDVIGVTWLHNMRFQPQTLLLFLLVSENSGHQVVIGS